MSTPGTAAVRGRLRSSLKGKWEPRIARIYADSQEVGKCGPFTPQGNAILPATLFTIRAIREIRGPSFLFLGSIAEGHFKMDKKSELNRRQQREQSADQLRPPLSSSAG